MGIASKDLTKKQAALVEIVASGSADTITEAAKMAGYSHRETGSKMLRSPTVQRAIQVRKAANGDTARALVDISTEVMYDYVVETRDPKAAATGMVAGATVLEKIGEREVGEDPSVSVDALRRFVWRAFMAGAETRDRRGHGYIEQLRHRLEGR